MNGIQHNRRHAHWAHGWIGVAVFLTFGAALIAFASAKGTPPAPNEVSEAVGHVEQIESRKGGLYFKLRESNILFVHHTGDLARVASELTKSQALVSVKYRNVQPAEPLFRDGSFYTVLAIHSDGRAILSEDLVIRGRAIDSWVGLAIGSLFLLYGLARVRRLTR